MRFSLFSLNIYIFIGDVSPTKVTDLLNHLISVIRDERVPLNYRNIYVDILLDVGLDFKYAQTIHEESFVNI